MIIHVIKLILCVQLLSRNSVFVVESCLQCRRAVFSLRCCFASKVAERSRLLLQSAPAVVCFERAPQWWKIALLFCPVFLIVDHCSEIGMILMVFMWFSFMLPSCKTYWQINSISCFQSTISSFLYGCEFAFWLHSACFLILCLLSSPSFHLPLSLLLNRVAQGKFFLVWNGKIVRWESRGRNYFSHNIEFPIIDTTSSQSSAVFYGLMGAASGLILSSIGAAYASSKPNIFHSQSSSSTNKQLPEWENANSSSSFIYQNKCKLSGIIPFNSNHDCWCFGHLWVCTLFY